MRELREVPRSSLIHKLVTDMLFACRFNSVDAGCYGDWFVIEPCTTTFPYDSFPAVIFDNGNLKLAYFCEPHSGRIYTYD